MEISNLEDGIVDALHYKISPKMISPKLVRTLLKQVSSTLPDYLVMAVTKGKMAEFYGLPIRLQMKQNKMILITKIPTYSPSSLMNLYQHVPIPIWSREEKVSLIMISNFNYLAINAEQTLHLDLSREELDICHKIGHIYFCPHLTVVYKGDDSCLKALFLSQMVQAQHRCQVTFQLSKKSMVYQVDQEWFLIVQAQKEYATLRCLKNQTDMTLPIGLNKIHIPGGCTFSSPKFLISSSSYPIHLIPIQMHLVSSNQWKDVTQLLVNNQKDVPIDDLRKSIKSISAHRNEVTLTELLDAADDAKKSLHHGWTWSSLSTSMVALIISVSLLIFLSYRFCQFTNKNPPLTTDVSLN
jgi:hypothetical protein